MELKVTRYDVDDAGIATIWLHRPERRNSWTGRMHAEYRWICRQLDDDPAVSSSGWKDGRGRSMLSDAGRLSGRPRGARAGPTRRI